MLSQKIADDYVKSLYPPRFFEKNSLLSLETGVKDMRREYGSCFSRESPPEDDAGKSTVHMTDSPETWHAHSTPLVHY